VADFRGKFRILVGGSLMDGVAWSGEEHREFLLQAHGRRE
jgi:hypothetical protein